MPKRKIPHRNLSPHGWWIASYLERFEYFDEDRRNPRRRCLAYENTVLLKARTREEAYRKLMKIGDVKPSECWDEATGRRGIWHFEGPTMLLPVCDPLEDGAELLWKVHRNRSVKKIKSLVRRKTDLPVFDDRETEVDIRTRADLVSCQKEPGPMRKSTMPERPRPA